MKIAQKKNSYRAITLSENKTIVVWRTNAKSLYTLLDNSRLTI